MVKTFKNGDFDFFLKKMNLFLLGEGTAIDRNRVKDICWKVFQEGVRYGSSLT